MKESICCLGPHAAHAPDGAGGRGTHTQATGTSVSSFPPRSGRDTLAIEKMLYAFLRGLQNPETGLVAEDEGGAGTTVWANALAALAFVHEGDLEPALAVLEVFDNYLIRKGNSFHGFPHRWEVTSALPVASTVPWESEAAFLLLAATRCGASKPAGRVPVRFSSDLEEWLVRRVREDGGLVAEATALTYAALRVRGIDSRIHGLLESLKARFFFSGTVSSADYTHSLTHRCLGALVFGDAHALQDVTVFRRCERMPHYGIEGISAYSQISSDLSVSIEASAQLALAWSSCAIPVHTGLNDLLTNLLILQTEGHKHPGTVGLPRAVPAPSASTSMVVPAVEPTCYLLFALWRYNPFALF